MRYAGARIAEAEREETFRIYAARCLQALVGTDVGYYELAHGPEVEDFDAEEVVDGVIARMGLEEEDEA